ncbi:YqjF family protein [Chitinophaga sp. GCM10012297]|uniref:DUF2071 domain-containing protein n=1 Tax=Chitinophaga chungangae TaxID=2821488 RepID=A0ABS3YBQ1_9BACT|nr:DUF2071 domain-containing protein [Chitinophaga chungangae]MBO9152098.1 DUF2071 domain-containing protein [Chitinophaga chungangae]
MNNRLASRLLHHNVHRPLWKTPQANWIWYQEWNRVLFFHWKVDAGLLQSLIPSGLELDTFEGQAWVSVVAFTMENIRPRFLPAVSAVSDFHEVNVRTYVRSGEDAGVYFFSLEAQKYLSVKLSRTLSGMPYETSGMQREHGEKHFYRSVNKRTGNFLEADYEPGAELAEKSPLDAWLTERYYTFLDKGGRLYKYAVHHPEWRLYEPKFRHLEIRYKTGPFSLSHANLEAVHYSGGVHVIAWPKVML